MSLKAKFFSENSWKFWVNAALKMFDLVDFQILSALLYLFGDLDHDNKDKDQGFVLLFVL